MLALAGERSLRSKATLWLPSICSGDDDTFLRARPSRLDAASAAAASATAMSARALAVRDPATIGLGYRVLAAETDSAGDVDTDLADCGVLYV